MGSRDQVYGSVSSLVVRPSNSGGGGGGNEYEPGEIRREEARHFDHHRSDRERERDRDRDRDRDRFLPTPSSASGYNMKGYKVPVPNGSVSPMRPRKPEQYGHDYDRNDRDFDRGGIDRSGRDFDHVGRDFRRGGRDFSRGGRDFNRGGRDFDRGVRDFDRGVRDFDHDFEHRGPSRGRGFRGGRGRGRFRDRSPPFGRGRGRPPLGRGFSGPAYDAPEPFRGESAGRNNPNVAPREGDWICSEPTCGNLNFARRTHCNNCNKPRRDVAPFSLGVGSPIRGYQRPLSPPLMDAPPMGRGMGRGGSGFGPPPVRWGRGGPREFDQGVPPRPAERFSDFRSGRDIRDRPEFRDNDEFADRGKFDRAPPVDWGLPLGSRDRERDDRFHEKRGPQDTRSDRHPPSPPPPPRSRWGKDARERSRSPIRSVPKEYYREPYADHRRDDKRGGRRDRLDDTY